jgi:hypothetical protein
MECVYCAVRTGCLNKIYGVFSKYLGFPLSLFFQQCSIHTLLLVVRTNERRAGTVKERNAVPEIGEHETEKYFRVFALRGEPGECSRYSDYATGWTIRNFEPR